MRACYHFSWVQLFVTLWTIYSSPGSSVHRILQARIPERVAMSFSQGSSWPRDQTCISSSSWITGRFFTTELSKWLIYIYTYIYIYIHTHTHTYTHTCVCVHVCINTRYLFSSFWHTLLCITGSSFIHLSSTDSNSFLFYGWVTFHYILYPTTSFSIHLPMDI